MVIIYLHGFRTVANSGKSLVLQEMFPQYRVVSAHYTPHDPILAEKELRALVDSLPKGSKVLVIGTSLGGFWARWLASEYQLTALIINPSLDPGNTLPVGQYTLFDQKQTPFEVTEKMFESFDNYKVNPAIAKDLDCKVWVALDDEVLDANAIIRELEEIHPLTCFKNGGHRFNQFEDMQPSIQKMISTVSEGL